MSDSDFVDVGDELVVRIAGYPVGTAKVAGTSFKGNLIVEVVNENGRYVGTFYLPPNFKDYDTVDGVAHNGPVPECNCPNGPHICGLPEYLSDQIKGRDDI
jgi:hypothetical protein